MLYARRKLFFIPNVSKYLERCPKHELPKTPCNISFNVNYISSSINYTVIVLPISLLVYGKECVNIKTVLMVQQASYTEAGKSLAFEEAQSLGCR